jgi:hypothetical protein
MRAVARVTKEEEDEYAVTEDEEGQEDQGIEDDDEEGFSPIGQGMARTSGSAVPLPCAQLT